MARGLGAQSTPPSLREWVEEPMIGSDAARLSASASGASPSRAQIRRATPTGSATAASYRITSASGFFAA